MRKLLIIGFLSGLLQCCASADQYGFDLDIECNSNLDCVDSDPHTMDICEPDGFCRSSQTTEINDDPICEYDMEIRQDGTSLISLPAKMEGYDGRLTNSIPIQYATVVKVDIKYARQVIFTLFENAKTFGYDPRTTKVLLLTDCYNLAVNRKSNGNQGPSILLNNPEPGDYYLAIYSTIEQDLFLDLAIIGVGYNPTVPL